MASEFIDRVKQIYAPSKIGISHKLITMLLEVSENYTKAIPTIIGSEVMDELQKFTSSEEAFLIAKTEYEQKEKRFLDNLYFSLDKLEQEYHSAQLSFLDINQEELLKAVKSFSLIELSKALTKNRKIIDLDCDHCYGRVNLLKRIWRRESDLLVEQLTNLEHRGLKIVSNNLRLKLLPEVKELKSALRDSFTKKSNSRKEIQDKLSNYQEQVKEDIFGDLTESQISLYTSLSEEVDIVSLNQILLDENSKNDLLELIKLRKIRLRIEKLFENLI